MLARRLRELRHTTQFHGARLTQGELAQINAELCHKFIGLWQADLVKWRQYLASIVRCDSIAGAFRQLGVYYAEFMPPRIR